MKTYIFLANGFEEIEALCPWDLLLRAGVDVTLVSINKDTAVTGTHGIIVNADTTADTLGEPEGQICTVLPGGMPGASNLDADPIVDSYITHSAKNGHLAAICAAPFVLGRRGLLNGKEATCFPGFEDELKGAVLSDKKVVTTENITTARGMGVAFEFGKELIRVLCGNEKAEQIAKATQA